MPESFRFCHVALPTPEYFPVVLTASDTAVWWEDYAAVLIASCKRMQTSLLAQG